MLYLVESPSPGTEYKRLQDRWENHIILRSSLIFGPQPPVPVSRQLFLQVGAKVMNILYQFQSQHRSNNTLQRAVHSWKSTCKGR